MPVPPRKPTRRTRTTVPMLLVVVAVAALFIAGVWVGGILGAALVGLLALVTGLLLASRWRILDRRIRLFRAAAVLVTAAVAISLLFRTG